MRHMLHYEKKNPDALRSGFTFPPMVQNNWTGQLSTILTGGVILQNSLQIKQ